MHPQSDFRIFTTHSMSTSENSQQTYWRLTLRCTATIGLRTRRHRWCFAGEIKRSRRNNCERFRRLGLCERSHVPCSQSTQLLRSVIDELFGEKLQSVFECISFKHSHTDRRSCLTRPTWYLTYVCNNGNLKLTPIHLCELMPADVFCH